MIIIGSPMKSSFYVRFIILVSHELSLVALVGWYYPQNDERIEDFTIENRGISCNAWIGIPQSCFSKKPMSLWCFFFPVKKKTHIPQKNIWRRIAQAAWWLGSEVFSIKKIPRKDERGAFLDILEVDPKNAQALRQNLDLKKLQKKNKQDMVQGGPLDML